MQISWLALQLADSAFPIGGFAHSGGLEAALQMGEVRSTRESLVWFCNELIAQTGGAGLPFVNSAHERPECLGEFDARCNAFLSNHVANRASRVQGRAFLSTCSRSFELAEIAALKPGHLAPLFGAVCRALNISLHDARQLFLFMNVRGALSAAVRLNAIGTYAAQQLQVALTPLMDRVLDESAGLRAEDAAQTSPLLDVFQMGHDRLYSRLFQS